MIHRDTSWYKGLYHWKMASACGLKAYLLYWYIMIQGSINKYSLGFFQSRHGTHGPKNLKSFWVLIFRVSFVSVVSNGVQTPFVMYHTTQFVCIMMYHEQHEDATNGTRQFVSPQVCINMYHSCNLLIWRRKNEVIQDDTYLRGNNLSSQPLAWQGVSC